MQLDQTRNILTEKLTPRSISTHALKPWSRKRWNVLSTAFLFKYLQLKFQKNLHDSYQKCWTWNKSEQKTKTLILLVEPCYSTYESLTIMKVTIKIMRFCEVCGYLKNEHLQIFVAQSRHYLANFISGHTACCGYLS